MPDDMRILPMLTTYYYNVGRYDDAPALNGKSETEAKNLADKAGFSVRDGGRVRAAPITI